MDTSRLIRFSVAGWAFATFLPLQAWILGADFTPIVEVIQGSENTTDALVLILAAVIASPILGFMVSSLGYLVQTILEHEVPVPTRNSDFEMYEAALKRITPRRSRSYGSLLAIFCEYKGSQGFYRRRLRWKLMVHFNLQFHKFAPQNVIEYTTRRWTVYWMHLNSLSAFAIATIFALRLADKPWECTYDLRFFTEIFLLSFFALSLWRIFRIKNEIYEFVWHWLYQYSGRTQAGRHGHPTDH